MHALLLVCRVLVGYLSMLLLPHSTAVRMAVSLGLSGEPQALPEGFRLQRPLLPIRASAGMLPAFAWRRCSVSMPAPWRDQIFAYKYAFFGCTPRQALQHLHSITLDNSELFCVLCCIWTGPHLTLRLCYNSLSLYSLYLPNSLAATGCAP